jgi:hypothetical protein
MTGGDAGRRSPCVNRYPHPRWHWCGTHAPVLPDKIDNAPAPIALLDVRESERRHFRTSQSAAEKNREDGAIAQPDDGRDVGRTQQRLRLPLGKLVPDADAGRFDAFHPADTLGQFRREQSVVCRLRLRACKSPIF